MVLYGKYNSLTLVNWNGFFARTFELDDLVTTLSGGNGAGKSTTMAAFVAALIPDLTLLHFRNTTEAGSTSGASDKGLYGKLRPGVCYAILDVLNSCNHRILCGVKLQQVAGRDKKVDIKPFIIQCLPPNITPTEVVTKRLSERQVRIFFLAELKDHLERIGCVQFKQFNSITDYHSMMFDVGILPKRLRSVSDRSKYYRLIEASLYGGISSAITRSLRDYLLPENSGVRKAFQDMEMVLRENRMTLEAIRVTQSDRDLFKHLITVSTDYVASDYMRHVNERRVQIRNALALRSDLFSKKNQYIDSQCQQVNMRKMLQEEHAAQKKLETDFQVTSDHWHLLQTAIRQQEKIARYQKNLEELQCCFEEQTKIAIESNEKFQAQQSYIDEVEREVDEIKSQLTNYQQALDSQQTRAIQYQQALQAIEKAKKFCNVTDLTSTNAKEYLALFSAKEEEITEQLLELEQTVSIAESAVNQFEKAYRLVQKLQNNVTENTAWQIAKTILKEWPGHVYQAEYVDTLQVRLAELEQRFCDKQEAGALFRSICNELGKKIAIEQLAEVQQVLQSQCDEIININDENKEEQTILQHEVEKIRQQIAALKKKAPSWLKAQDSLILLKEQSNEKLESTKQIMAYMQKLFTDERALTAKKDKLVVKRGQLEEQITGLSQPNGADDYRLSSLAERFNGVLLAEIYEDVSFDDASYFSALYGPSRQAIVVPDLQCIKAELGSIDDCPEDIYFIEGDPASFDESVFDCEELGQAVLVKSSDRQWRYSRFPSVPILGRVAREKRLEILSLERDQLSDQYASISFDLQKTQRLQQNLSQFIDQHLAIAFDADPEAAITQLVEHRVYIDRQLLSVQNRHKEHFQQITHLKKQLNLINRLEPYHHLFTDHDLADKIAVVRDQLSLAEVSADYVKKNKKFIAELEPLVPLLKNSPDQNLLQKYEEIKNAQRKVKKQVFVLQEVLSRKVHFSYADAVNMIDENSDINVELRVRLKTVEHQRDLARQRMRHYQDEHSQHSQTVASLKSAYDTKQDMLNDLLQEMSQIGVKADKKSEQKAQQKRDEMQKDLNNSRANCANLEKSLLLCENDLDQLQKKIKRVQRDYHLLCQQVIQAKITWRTVIRLVKENDVERRLHRRDLAYLNANELRSMSDKALGALRQAVADNEHLRDILRASEEAKYIEGKVHFYLAVYMHLRERIRQDIIKTDDPIEAIEQMEIELSRLTDELTTREQKLTISANSVANIIRKTIHREQNRIAMLNKNLQAVVFGQVHGVRLNVNIRDSHTTLLSVLAQQQDKHQDLFTNNRVTFSEALATLYKRLNPHIELGQRTPQTIGEELLDYRNYLDLDIEVNRGTDGWLRAESGALSTGEAIGTGMAILLIVIQSWEEESRRLRSKDILPCRLLFLDEAARLDTKSISTLFELCERLNMQLIIAAPENISPEKGTTYKLVRKVFNNQEHVHVVGLRGFS